MKSVCVFCGSNVGSDPAYADAARALGQELVRHNTTLVYGGGSVGLMGIIADAVLSLGGRAIGVIPQSLLDREVGHRSLTELHVVSTMHERKAKMSELSDGFIAMPGGLGTLEELFEVWTWAQLGIHRKPIGLLNVKGYYDSLIKFVRDSIERRFVPPTNLDMVITETSASNLLHQMADYNPPIVEKWLRASET